jgi:hypothetical protein
MDLYSPDARIAFSFQSVQRDVRSLSSNRHDRRLTNSCLFTIYDYAPIRFAACTDAIYITIFRIYTGLFISP